jgi:Ca2+-binding RTX toxin-like protein
VLGAGDDTFVWDPGDGSDVVEGQDGLDTMRFNGANIADQVDLSANGSRLRFFRNPGNITMDTGPESSGSTSNAPRRRRPGHRPRPARDRRQRAQPRARREPRR